MVIRTPRTTLRAHGIAALLAVLLLSACGDASPGNNRSEQGGPALAVPETAPPTSLVFSNKDALGWLRSTTERLSETDGSYVVGVVDLSASISEDRDESGAFYVTFPVSVIEVLWAPHPNAEALAAAASTIRVHLNEENEAWLLAYLETDPRVVAVYEPLSEYSTVLSPLVERDPDASMESGTFDLSWVLRDLMTSPLTVADRCSPDVEFVSASETEALSAHAAAIDAEARARADRTKYEELADQLASDHAAVDAVTGIPVEPDINDIARQLTEGTPVNQVQYQPVIPIVFDMRQYAGEPRVGLIVSTAGEYLGYMGIGPIDKPFVGEVRLPRDGGDIRIDLAMSPPDECGTIPGTLAELATIPIDIAAGDTRALVEVAGGIVTALTAAEFEALAAE